jgi:hypothetical protein
MLPRYQLSAKAPDEVLRIGLVHKTPTHVPDRLTVATLPGTTLHALLLVPALDRIGDPPKAEFRRRNLNDMAKGSLDVSQC